MIKEGHTKETLQRYIDRLKPGDEIMLPGEVGGRFCSARVVKIFPNHILCKTDRGFNISVSSADAAKIRIMSKAREAEETDRMLEEMAEAIKNIYTE